MRLQNQTDGINDFKHERFETMMITLNLGSNKHINKLHQTIIMSIIASSKFQHNHCIQNLSMGKQNKQPSTTHIYHQICQSLLLTKKNQVSQIKTNPFLYATFICLPSTKKKNQTSKTNSNKSQAPIHNIMSSTWMDGWVDD